MVNENVEPSEVGATPIVLPEVLREIEEKIRASEEAAGKADDVGKAAKETAEASTRASGEAARRAEEVSSAARAAAAAATRASEETARRAEEANQRTVAEVRLLATKAGKAEEALRKAGEVAMKMLTEWEGVVIVLALVAAAIMISFGLLSLR